MATLFEGMWRGTIPALPVMKDEGLGVMAIIANPQETIGQLVLFPQRPVPTYEDLTYQEENRLTLVTRALAKHMKRELGVERVVRHIEGYGVANHAHIVLLPSYQRGDSDKLHHPSEGQPLERLVEVQKRLILPANILGLEIADHQAYIRALNEDAT